MRGLDRMIMGTMPYGVMNVGLDSYGNGREMGNRTRAQRFEGTLTPGCMLIHSVAK